MKTYASRYADERDRKLKKKNDEENMVLRALSSYSKEDIQRKIAEFKNAPKRQKDATGRAIFAKVQAKLQVSQPQDAEEVQADKVAEGVMKGDTDHSKKTLSEKTRKDVSPKGEGDVAETSDAFDAKLQSTKGQGQKLDHETKSELEQHTGTDLDGVNVHTNSDAGKMSEDINAKAFTHGQDIYFKEGQYNPNSKDGKELLAHEVAHTVQQGEGVRKKEETERKDFGSSFLRGSQLKNLAYPTDDQKDLRMDNFIDVKSKLSKWPAIENIQNSLNYLYNDFEGINHQSKLEVIPQYTRKTKKAVKYFQKTYIAPKDRAFRTDGILDGSTLKWLDKALLEKQGNAVGKLASEASKNLEEGLENETISFGNCKLNTKYWEAEGSFNTAVMKKGVEKPSEAIMSIFNDGGSVECHTSTYIIWYKTLLDYWGEDLFNEIFKWRSADDPGLVITSSTPEKVMRIAEFRFDITGEFKVPDDLIPGDWVVYTNDERYTSRHPGGPYHNENLIYIGEGKYNGFAMGLNLEEKDIKADMIKYFVEEPSAEEKANKSYNPNATIDNPNPKGFLPIIRRLNMMTIEETKKKNRKKTE